MKSKKQIRQDRLWRHFKSFLDNNTFGADLRIIENYDPEKWRSAFFSYQSTGAKNLTPEELYYIHPLINAQKFKEITLTSLAIESMEWWSVNKGWIYPWLDVISRKPIDRLFKVACMRTMREISKDSLDFFLRHPGIPNETKQRYLSIKFP